MLNNTLENNEENREGTPLVRGRSTVQSCPAAPIFQWVSRRGGPRKTPKRQEQIAKCAGDSCKIRVALFDPAALALVLAALGVAVWLGLSEHPSGPAVVIGGALHLAGPAP